jgi:endoglycosylceramidase
MMRRSLALACLTAALALPAGAQAGPTLPLGHAGRWITDASGRVVIVHGINMVYKLAPFYPAAVGFGDDDAAFLARIGFNAVRVGVIWKAVEPQPGVYDNAYLNQIASTVKTLARHGILSLLDFHQDLYNELFQGEGAPDWAVQDGGLPNPALGFPGNYLGNPALQHALDAFWGNASGPGGVGLENRFAGAWAHVAARFGGERSVLGYELFNEPWPGTLWQPCAVSPGCPSFDAKLTAFYRTVDKAIRVRDRRTLVWYEPNVLFDESASTSVGTVGDPRTGFSFHDYCLTAGQPNSQAVCAKSNDMVFAGAVAHTSQTRQALMLTEFGATNDASILTDMVARADRDMVPWLEWAYCGCQDPTTSGPGKEQAIVIDPAKPPARSNLVLPTLHALVEPYPQLIAGTPRPWRYTAATNRFGLQYSTARATGAGSFPVGSITEVATPAFAYPHGYAAAVNGGRVVSRRNAGVLQIAVCPHTTHVSLTVTPSGRSHGSCRAPARTR